MNRRGAFVINQDDINTAQTWLKTSLDDVDNLALMLSSDDIAYLGFDPTIMLATLYKHARAANIEMEVHNKNIATLAAISATRGTNWVKLREKSTEKMRTFLNTCYNTYHMIDGRPTGTHDVTLGRVAACYAAQITVGIANNTFRFAPVVDTGVYKNLPPCMRTTVFASLIPTTLPEDEINLLLTVHNILQGRFTAVIRKDLDQHGRQKTKLNLDSINRYTIIQFQSVYYNDDTRMKMLEKAQIINLTDDGNCLLVEGVKRACIAVAALLDEVFVVG